jgi:hypothetical protein
MTLISDVQTLRRQVEDIDRRVIDDRSLVQTHEEQINGARGLSASIKKLDDDIAGLKKSIWTVGGMIFASMVGFSISVLTVFGG